MGLIGLFLGAIVLSVGYKLFIAWVEGGNSEPVTSSAATKCEGCNYSLMMGKAISRGLGISLVAPKTAGDYKT